MLKQNFEFLSYIQKLFEKTNNQLLQIEFKIDIVEVKTDLCEPKMQNTCCTQNVCRKLNVK